MLQNQSYNRTLTIWLAIAVIAGFFGIRVLYQYPPSTAIITFFILNFNIDVVLLLPFVASVVLLAAAFWGKQWLMLIGVVGMLAVLITYLQMFSGTIQFVVLTMLPFLIAVVLLMLNVFCGYRFGTRVKQSFLLASILITALLIPEVMFAIIDFKPKQMLEIRSFTIALFVGVFILSVFSSVKSVAGKE
ncbi:hypothetical protein ACLI1A_15655 [Flavobacterium sp. RHBU_3]|uniref:hypothetical protein n=1 Tax=Flavobacterium sp. RHBU_3 TaxID=3391184 RepID=UPI003984E2B6